MNTPSLPARAREKRLAERSRSGRLIRDSICLLSSKWAVDVLLALGDGTRRYHEPSAFSGGAIEAPSEVSAYSTRGGTSACTRRATSPSRSIARSVWVSTFSEIGERSSSSSW